jgi:hypothetical protein
MRKRKAGRKDPEEGKFMQETVDKPQNGSI